MFTSVPEQKRNSMISLLDQQADFIAEMHAASRKRLEIVLKTPPSSSPSISRIFTNHFSRPNSRSSSPAPDADRGDKPDVVPTVKSDPGPGAYLGRWQDLLDSTLITPLTAEGPVRKAGSEAVVENSTIDVDGEKLVEFDALDQKKVYTGKNASKPDVSIILDEMLPAFRKLLAEKSCSW
jgi:hypothetical protein